MRNRHALTLALGLLVASCGGDSGSTATTTTVAAATTTEGSTVATTVPDTTTTVAPAAAWVRVPAAEDVFGGPGDDSMAGIATGGPGFVAVGSDYEGGNGSDGGEISDGDAAVWTSSDGITWTRVPHDEAVFGGDNFQEMQAVIAFGSGFVAVGVDAAGGIESDAAVWTSPDGVNWNRVLAGEAVLGGPGNQAMLRLVEFGPGLVAVGFEDAAGGFDWDAAVWTSPDGVNWSRVPHDEAVFGGDRIQVMWGVVPAAVGLVAVGSDRSGESNDAAVWTSPDGLVWSRVPNDPTVFGGPGNQRMASVIATDAGVIAVGADGSGGDDDAAVWSSADGATWLRVVNPEAVLGGDGNQGMTGIALWSSGFVAVGSDDSAGDSDAAVWTSVDGLTWSRAENPDGALGASGDQSMYRVVAVGSGLVGVGTDNSGGDIDVMVWTLS